MKRLIVLLVLSAALVMGQGKTWSKSKSKTGPNGKTASIETQGSAGDGQFSRTKVATGPNGKSATSETTGTYGNGTASSSTVKTGPNGKSITTSRTRTRSRN
jgi:hypothetical protein